MLYANPFAVKLTKYVVRLLLLVLVPDSDTCLCSHGFSSGKLVHIMAHVRNKVGRQTRLYILNKTAGLPI